MQTRTTRKIRLPSTLGADRIFRQTACLDAAQIERREQLDALRGTLRSAPGLRRR